MRLAFIGKGGSGKSTIAATYARLLAREGRDVVAIDSDPMPGLCFGLGLAPNEHPIPDDAVVERADEEEGPRFRLRPGLDATAALARFAATAADGVRFLSFEKSRGDWGTTARSQHAWSQIVSELPEGEFDLIGDLPGGTRQPMTGWAKYADALLIVVEPTPVSMATARRLASLSGSKWAHRSVVAVANRVREPGDAARIADCTGLMVIGAVPDDLHVARADRMGLAPLDAAPESPFVTAVSALVAATVARYDTTSSHTSRASAWAAASPKEPVA